MKGNRRAGPGQRATGHPGGPGAGHPDADVDRSGGATATYANPTPIVVPRPGQPPDCPTIPTMPGCGDTANPYPADISVAGRTGTVTDVNVTLDGLWHNAYGPNDLDIMVVAPNKTGVMLMSDACGVESESASGDITIAPADAITVSFDDQAAQPLPADAACSTGTFQPVDDEDSNFTMMRSDEFLPEGTTRVPPLITNSESTTYPTPNTALLSAFDGIDPNGTWSLYVIDDWPTDACTCPAGEITDGWSIEIATTDPTTTTLPPTPSTTVPDEYLTQICNPAPIVQPNDFTFVSGASIPYPSPIVVSGLTGTVTDVEMSLFDWTTGGGESNTWPNDMDILAAAPDNSNVILVSDAGGDNNFSTGSVVDVDLTFDDEAAEQLTANGRITTGTWRPVDDDGDPLDDAGPDVWLPPAPPLMDTTLLSTFDGIDPNGVWNLFVNDDQVLGTTQILGGWCLNITTTTSTGPTTTTTTVPTSTTTVPPPATGHPIADFDGDGDSDVSVFRPASGAWYRQDSPDTTWGTTGDIPVPADYDGDGDNEVAVFRPADGVWYVEGGDATAWGTNGDIPVPADYDGDRDARADPAVFRPSDGVWYIQGGHTVGWGTDGDQPLTLPAAIYRAMNTPDPVVDEP